MGQEHITTHWHATEIWWQRYLMSAVYNQLTQAIFFFNNVTEVSLTSILCKFCSGYIILKPCALFAGREIIPGITESTDSHCEQDCGEFDNSGQVLIAPHISGNKLETPLHVVIRMELDEGCETGGNAQSVPSISKQHNISREIGGVTTHGMSSPGVMPGNTDVHPGVFADMTRNTQLNSLAFDYVDQGTAGSGLQGQEFGSFSDRGYDQSTRGCGLQGIHVGSDTGHSTQDSGGSVQEILWSK